MTEFSFLAVPNIEGLWVLRYVKMIVIVIVLGVSLFFVIFFWIRYRRKHLLFHQFTAVDLQAQIMKKQLLQKRIHTATDKTKLVLFIEYLEKFVTNTVYANIGELLISQGFTQSEAQELCEVLYTDKRLSANLAMKINDLI